MQFGNHFLNRWEKFPTNLISTALSLTLSPLAHATFEINNNLKNPETFAHTQLLGNIATKRYTVNIGETAETIAQKFNMNLEQLQELNSKTPYTKQLSELKPGDILLVPLTALPREIATPKAHIATAEEIQQQAAYSCVILPPIPIRILPVILIPNLPLKITLMIQSKKLFTWQQPMLPRNGQCQFKIGV